MAAQQSDGAQAVSEAEYEHSIRAMRTTWQRMVRAEGEADLRGKLAAAERRVAAADAERDRAQHRELLERQARAEVQSRLDSAQDALAVAQSDLQRTREALKKETARADLEQRKFTVLANKLGISTARNTRPNESDGGTQDTRRGAAFKRAREPAAPTVPPAHSAQSSLDHWAQQTCSKTDDDPRPCVLRRIDDPPAERRTPIDSRNGPASNAPVAASQRARAGSSGGSLAAASVDSLICNA